MTLHTNIRQQLLTQLGSELPESEAIGQLNNALRLLAKWRSVLIQNTLVKHQGTTVLQGPLAGLQCLPQSAEGCHIAKLLGCYEQPLLPFIEQAIQDNYPLILNIGCAEGYYAVGMARRMADTRVLAYDLNPNAQDTCRQVSQLNGTQERVEIGPLFTPEDFARFAGQRVLVLCDIEGGEQSLLNPEVAPALKDMDLIVESHDCLVPGITALLIQRFQLTHDITVVRDDGQRQLQNPPDWFCSLSHLDQLLAVWEWRTGPTPWLVMKAKSTVG